MKGADQKTTREWEGHEETSPLIEALLERRAVSRKSLIAGVVGTILFHLIGFFGIPDDLFTTDRVAAENPYREYELEFVPLEEEPEQIYTQTNPDAPDNEPDQTNNFAARNQQAAQETPPEEIDDENRPSSESDDDIETNQFVSGDLSPPQFSPPPSPQTPEQEQQEETQDTPLLVPQLATQPLIKAIPIQGAQEEKDPDETGVAEVDYDKDEAPTNVNEYIKGEAEEGEEEEQLAGTPTPFVAPSYSQDVYDPSDPAPRPRPRLPKVAPGPVRDRIPGVSKTGRIAVDAKFSEFGEYMERLIETVSVRWNSLAEDGAFHENRSKVVLRFRLNKNGYISELRTDPETTARVIGIYMCRTAVEEGAPYGPWTPEMVEVFGDDEEITFSFHYY